MTAAFVMAGLGVGLWLAIVPTLLRTMKRSPAAIALGCGALVYLAVLAISLACRVRVAFWDFSAAYGFIILCLLMAFGALYKSVSLRILGDLSKIPEHAMSERELFVRYIEEESFARRVGILLERDLAERSGGALKLSTKGRRIAACIQLLQRTFTICASG